MRVLRVYPFLPPLSGGMEKHIQRLTQEQRLLGCDVTVIFNRGNETSPNDLKVCPTFNLRSIKPQALRDFIFHLAVLAKIMSGSIRADIVHLHGDWSSFLFGRLLRWATGAQIMAASMHGVVRKGRWAWVYKRVLSGYGVVYCTGAGDARYLQHAGVAGVQWQNSGIDAEFFSNKTAASGRVDAADIACVANFFPVKNLVLVIEIARDMPDVRFVLIGDGPQRSALEAICLKDKLKNVRFTGKLSAREISQQLNASCIFLSTSFSEGTPTALLEAMACGLPVVTSRSNDYRDLIDIGRNGYVIDNFDVKSYVKLLRELLSNQPLREAISSRNKAEARRHAWPEVAKRITSWMHSSFTS
jgi:glycosyltransferase involved in cell wall biosynthesis